MSASITSMDEFRRVRDHIIDRRSPSAAEADRMTRHVETARRMVREELAGKVDQHYIRIAEQRCDNRVRSGRSIRESVDIVVRVAINEHNNPPPEGPQAA